MDMAQEAEAFAPEITEELPLSSPTESVANETMSSAGIPPEWQIPLTVFVSLSFSVFVSDYRSDPVRSGPGYE